MHATWVLKQFLLICLCHAADLWILPLGGVFLAEESLLLFLVSTLHQLMLLFKLLKLSCECSDALTLVGILLEKLLMGVLQMIRLFGKLVSPL